jgi:putative aldouronate transport system permease protein
MSKRNYFNKGYWNNIVDCIILAILVILAVCMIIPFYNAVLVSITPYKEYVQQPLYIIPTGFDFGAYKIIFSNKLMYTSILVSIFNSTVGTLLAMFITTITGYALSKKNMPGRNILLSIIIFTMYFSGGLVPWYLVVRSLGLRNNLLVMIIPNALNTFYMILMKNYFNTIPSSLEDSAKLDGANDLYILWRIILPVSAPIIASISLFYAVDRWNDWWMAMLFVDTPEKWPLPYILRKVAIEATMDLVSTALTEARDRYKEIFPLTVQMATVVVTAIPIICVYPFLQKHFAKGILLGSIKA